MLPSHFLCISGPYLSHLSGTHLASGIMHAHWPLTDHPGYVILPSIKESRSVCTDTAIALLRPLWANSIALEPVDNSFCLDIPFRRLTTPLSPLGTVQLHICNLSPASRRPLSQALPATRDQCYWHWVVDSHQYLIHRWSWNQFHYSVFFGITPIFYGGSPYTQA